MCPFPVVTPSQGRDSMSLDEQRLVTSATRGCISSPDPPYGEWLGLSCFLNQEIEAHMRSATDPGVRS